MEDTLIPRSTIGRMYDFVLTATHNDEFTILVVVSLAIGILAFVVGNAFFVYLDLVDPKWVQRYRIQEEDTKKVSLSRWISSLGLISFNLIVVGFLMSAVLYVIGKQLGFGLNTSRELPSFWTGFVHMVFFMFVEEVGFYYTHRLFHHPRIYKYVHKIHHEWTAPISITSVYAHPLEHAISNLLPVMLGPVFLHSHVVVAWIWYTVAIWSTTVSHSGYHLPFLPSAEAHDHHHMMFNECYGVLGILDTFHGTNKTFQKSVKSQRHRMMMTTTPVKAAYPDPPKRE